MASIMFQLMLLNSVNRIQWIDSLEGIEMIGNKKIDGETVALVSFAYFNHKRLNNYIC